MHACMPAVTRCSMHKRCMHAQEGLCTWRWRRHAVRTHKALPGQGGAERVGGLPTWGADGPYAAAQ